MPRPARVRRPRHPWPVRCLAAAIAVVLAGCGSGGEPPGTTAEPTPATPTSVAPLPPSEHVATLGVQSIRAGSSPDFALAVGGTVWVAGANPGIVGYDAVTGNDRVRVRTGDVPLAMEQGFDSLWAGEESGPVVGTVVRVNALDGAVLARIPVPAPGLRRQSSLAVTDNTVWGLVDGANADSRLLVAIDPATNTVRGTLPAPGGAEALRGGFGSLWVATSRQSVVRVDPVSGSTLATIGTGSGSRFMAVGPDAVWVMNQQDGTVSRIDPATNTVVATVRVSDGRIPRGDIAVGPAAVWVRTERELATAIDPATNSVVRVLGPASGNGGVAVSEGAVWLVAQRQDVVYRLPTA